MVQSLIPIWEVRSFPTYKLFHMKPVNVLFLCLTLRLVLQEEYERTGIHETALPSDPDRPLSQDVLRALSLGLGFENKLMEFCGKVEETLSFNELGPYEKEMKAAPFEEKDVCPELLSVGERQSSETMLTSDPKVISIYFMLSLLEC